MKTSKKIRILLVLALLIYGGYHAYHLLRFARGVQADVPKFRKSLLENKLQNGDIIFQTSQSNQSKAIQLATHSPYSHVGIIYQIDGKWYVYEAVQPVKLTPIQKWIKRGKNGHFVVKRLKNAREILTPQSLLKMKQTGEKFKGMFFP